MNDKANRRRTDIIKDISHGRRPRQPTYDDIEAEDVTDKRSGAPPKNDNICFDDLPKAFERLTVARLHFHASGGLIFSSAAQYHHWIHLYVDKNAICRRMDDRSSIWFLALNGEPHANDLIDQQRAAALQLGLAQRLKHGRGRGADEVIVAALAYLRDAFPPDWRTAIANEMCKHFASRLDLSSDDRAISNLGVDLLGRAIRRTELGSWVGYGADIAIEIDRRCESGRLRQYRSMVDVFRREHEDIIEDVVMFNSPIEVVRQCKALFFHPLLATSECHDFQDEHISTISSQIKELTKGSESVQNPDLSGGLTRGQQARRELGHYLHIRDGNPQAIVVPDSEQLSRLPGEKEFFEWVDLEDSDPWDETEFSPQLPSTLDDFHIEIINALADGPLSATDLAQVLCVSRRSLFGDKKKKSTSNALLQLKEWRLVCANHKQKHHLNRDCWPAHLQQYLPSPKEQMRYDDERTDDAT